MKTIIFLQETDGNLKKNTKNTRTQKEYKNCLLIQIEGVFQAGQTLGSLEENDGFSQSSSVEKWVRCLKS